MLLIMGLNFIKSNGYNPIWSHKGFFEAAASPQGWPPPVARPPWKGRRSKTAFLAFRTFLLRFGTTPPHPASADLPASPPPQSCKEGGLSGAIAVAKSPLR